ncbi:uncharacterized protein ARMOST_10304 [Armillaria ostoyae]|uniref:Uncharacterized protein n=1 Tax=Armillaria ostoyae TaxID=47428 RepID=A0A284RDY2_ARMOS|nr:uncharacterized protein ARMOST_10304 [Armillaria ostoyae]
MADSALTMPGSELNVYSIMQSSTGPGLLKIVPKSSYGQSRPVIIGFNVSSPNSGVLIVGKGLHCEDGEAKLRPAIMGLMRKYQLAAEFDPSNSGVIVVELNGLTPIRHRQHLNISHRHSSGRHGRRRASNIGA